MNSPTSPTCSDEINSLAQLDAREQAEYDRWLAEQEAKDELEPQDDGPDESMDGDFDSAMASAGHGTDEDYGYFGESD